MIGANKRVFLFVFLFFSLQSKPSDTQKPIVILTASYNNKDWYERNLSSLFGQRYDNWRLIYINDCSTDQTSLLVQEYVRKSGQSDRVTFVDNKVRQGHLANQYAAIHTCKPHEIVVILDGDDWLAHNNVLHYINNSYQNPEVWMTYGQFWYYKRNVRGMCHAIPHQYVVNNSARKYSSWVLSHLRTFYAGLFHQIDLQDLLYHGSFYPMFADGVVMYPLFEMAAERAQFIPDVLCIYNDANQISFLHDRREQQMEIRKHVLSQKPYNRLEHAFFLKQ